MTTQRKLIAAARRLHGILKARDLKVVFAESCTGGLVAATLTRIPGISQYLCGSAVVYQVETKGAWLGIPRAMLIRSDAVSSAVAAAMAKSVLKKTPQADLAASITGHLGPDAPSGFDGLIYVGIANRQRGRSGSRNKLAAQTLKGRLSKGRRTNRTSGLRVDRQREAALRVLSALGDFLSEIEPVTAS